MFKYKDDGTTIIRVFGLGEKEDFNDNVGSVGNNKDKKILSRTQLEQEKKNSKFLDKKNNNSNNQDKINIEFNSLSAIESSFNSNGKLLDLILYIMKKVSILI